MVMDLRRERAGEVGGGRKRGKGRSKKMDE
jgi:hypothetical protein